MLRSEIKKDESDSVKKPTLQHQQPANIINIVNVNNANINTLSIDIPFDFKTLIESKDTLFAVENKADKHNSKVENNQNTIEKTSKRF